ncbi:MAG: cytochrome c oxidase subunit 3 [Saprospiraceae bacterium]|jgi:cytochrome c oxidase subunit 3
MSLAIQQQTQNKIHPHKFALWVACASITMMFMAWTSAYVVRQAAGNWLEFRLPNIFFINTAVLLLSSVTLHLSYIFFKKEIEALYKGLLVVSFLLGISFLVLQYQGWVQLYGIGVAVDGNPAGSFIYVFTGFHGLHIFGGLAAIFVAIFHAFGLKFKPTPKRKLRFELTLTIWHFLDFLWLYIITFIVLQS